MEPKKNPNADPKRNSWLFFQLGLAAIVLLSYLAIESKTYEKEIASIKTVIDDSFLDEEVPITTQINQPPPPPPPPPAPEVIQVIEDEAEVEEVVIESTETNQEQKIVKAEKIEVFEEEVEVDVPFAIIEDVPVFPGCEKVAKDKRKDCLQEQIQKHIRKNFNYPEAAMDAGIQGRVFVSFVIGKDGNVSIANLRGPDKSLEKEAERIMSKLPKMTPGKQRGKPVRMTMSIPITFKLDR
jgi:protein TonB